MIKKLLATSVLAASLAFPAWADDETDALRTQIKLLEARLDALEKKQTQQQTQQQSAQQTRPLTPAVAVPASPIVPAGSSLETRVGALEQKQAVEQEEVQKTPDITYGLGKGLTVTSPDKEFKLRFAGYVQADNRTFFDNNTSLSGVADQFLIRSARTIIEAQIYEDFNSRLMWDFGNGQTLLLDAYLDYNAAQPLNFRVGKFKDPIGIERWQSEQDVLFVERGMTTNLVPYRDNGIEIYGSPIAKALEYEIAFTDGAADFVNATSGTDSPKTVTGRLFAHPFSYTGLSWLQGFGVGVAGSFGRHDGTTTNNDLTTGYVTPGQAKFFLYNTSAFASGDDWRLNPQAMYYKGPFSLISEYVQETQGLQIGKTVKTLQNNAWMVTSTYVLTGEDARFDGVVPRENFDPKTGNWGAFEIVGRLSQLHIDSATFPTFASLTTSPDAAYESTFGGTWYLNPAVKFNMDFALTRFDAGALNNTDRATEKALLSRVQFKF